MEKTKMANFNDQVNNYIGRYLHIDRSKFAELTR